MNSTESRNITIREGVAVAVFSVVVTVVMTWPLVTTMGDVLPGMSEIGDPYLHAWQVKWQAHALITDPADFFDANTQWPHENSLAFLDTLIGYTPVGFIGSGIDAAIARYNTLYLFAYAFAFFGAYFLARHLGVGKAGALVAAAAFAFAPWRAAQNGHIAVLSSGGMPLALAFLLSGYRKRRGTLVIIGGVVAAWQLSLGFNLGLQFAYLLGLLAAIFLFRVWRKKEANLTKTFLAAVAAAASLFVVIGGLLAWPYFRVAATHPEVTHRFAEIQLYSPPPSGFAVAPRSNLVWGDAAGRLHEHLRWPEEQTLFPGVMIVGLALVGAWWGPLHRKVKIFLVGGVAFLAILSMGTAWGPSRILYSTLYEIAPGWQGVRTPGRLNTSTSLGLALLSGAGTAAVISALNTRARRAGGHIPRMVVTAVIAVAFLGVLVEGRASISAATPRPVPAGLEIVADPVLHLPFDEIHDRIYTFWSVSGFPRTVNGVGAIVPEDLRELREEMTTFPDANTVDSLRDLGVASVVLHPHLAESTPWSDAAEASVDSLGIIRQEVGDVIIFDLR